MKVSERNDRALIFFANGKIETNTRFIITPVELAAEFAGTRLQLHSAQF